MDTPQWYFDRGLRIIPTWSPKHKGVCKGYGRKRDCTVEDFQGGRGIKLVTGEQPNGYYLVSIDDDDGGDWVEKSANELPDIYGQLVIANSTHGDGLHAFFLTSEPIETSTGHTKQIEIKGIGGIGVNAPTNDRIVQWGNGFAVLSKADTWRLLNFLGYRRKKPRQLPKSATEQRQTVTRNDGYIPDPIADFNSKHDIDDLAKLIDAKQSAVSSDTPLFHCGCNKHKNKDSVPSLTMLPAKNRRNGQYVVHGHMQTCDYAGTHHAFGLYCIRYSLSIEEALKQLYPDNLLINQTSQEATQGAPETTTSANTSETIDISPDTLRKRRERARDRDVSIPEIKQLIEQDIRIKPRARLVAGALLADKKLQSNLTNKEIATQIGASERTVQYGIRELEEAGYGKRHGGWKHGERYIRPTWTFYRVQKDNCSVKVLHPLDLNASNSDEEGTRERRTQGDGTSDVIEELTTLADLVEMAFVLAHETGRRISCKFVADFVQNTATQPYDDKAIKYHYDRIRNKNRYARQNARQTEKAHNMTMKDLKRAARATGTASAEYRRRGKEDRATVERIRSGIYEAEITRREDGYSLVCRQTTQDEPNCVLFSLVPPGADTPQPLTEPGNIPSDETDAGQSLGCKTNALNDDTPSAAIKPRAADDLASVVEGLIKVGDLEAAKRVAYRKDAPPYLGEMVKTAELVKLAAMFGRQITTATV